MLSSILKGFYLWFPRLQSEIPGFALGVGRRFVVFGKKLLCNSGGTFFSADNVPFLKGPKSRDHLKSMLLSAHVHYFDSLGPFSNAKHSAALLIYR